MNEGLPSFSLPICFCFAENESKWLGFDVEGLNSGQVWNGTPFGALFLAHYDSMMEEEELAESFDLKENPYYNKAFTGYLLKTILPCTPLVTHCFFGPTQDYLREDTQAVVENTFRGIKIDELGRQGKNKIGRYIRIRKATLKGTSPFNTQPRHAHLYMRFYLMSIGFKLMITTTPFEQERPKNLPMRLSVPRSQNPRNPAIANKESQAVLPNQQRGPRENGRNQTLIPLKNGNPTTAAM